MRLFEAEPEAYLKAMKAPIFKSTDVMRSIMSLSDDSMAGSELKNRIRATMGIGQ